MTNSRTSTATERNVAVLLDADFAHGSRILSGVRDAARRCAAPWCVLPLFPGPGAPSLADLLHLRRIDAVIGSFPSDRWLETLMPLRVPIVNIGDSSHIRSVPSVVPDNIAVGRLAARHLLQARAPMYGLISDSASFASQQRARGFLAALAAAGVPPKAIAQPPADIGFSAHVAWANWACRQPRPFAVYCTDDFLARRFVATLRSHGLSIPDDVAVLGTGDSSLETVLAEVPVSSVRLPVESIGAEAMRCIDEMARAFREKAVRVEALSHELAPDGIAARESTAIGGGRGYVVERALLHIDDHLSDPLRVSEIADFCHVSRRTLENAFRKTLGRSPAQEVRLRRMDLARRLLAEGDRTLVEVSELCGYGGDPRFWPAFRKATGMTPRDYRSHHRQSP